MPAEITLVAMVKATPTWGTLYRVDFTHPITGELRTSYDATVFCKGSQTSNGFDTAEAADVAMREWVERFEPIAQWHRDGAPCPVETVTGQACQPDATHGAHCRPMAVA